jgi:hypothetical protein
MNILELSMSEVKKVSYVNQTTTIQHSHDELGTLELMLQTAEENELTKHLANMFGFDSGTEQE